MSDRAEQVAAAHAHDQRKWREYQRNRREASAECPECGGEADRTTIHGQTSIACHEDDCLHYEVINDD